MSSASRPRTRPRRRWRHTDGVATTATRTRRTKRSSSASNSSARRRSMPATTRCAPDAQDRGDLSRRRRRHRRVRRALERFGGKLVFAMPYANTGNGSDATVDQEAAPGARGQAQVGRHHHRGDVHRQQHDRGHHQGGDRERVLARVDRNRLRVPGLRRLRPHLRPGPVEPRVRVGQPVPAGEHAAATATRRRPARPAHLVLGPEPGAR